MKLIVDTIYKNNKKYELAREESLGNKKFRIFEILEGQEKGISEIDLYPIDVYDIWHPNADDINVRLFNSKNERINQGEMIFPFVFVRGEEILDGVSSSESMWAIDIKDLENPKLINEPIFIDLYEDGRGEVVKQCRISGTYNENGEFLYLHISCPVIEYKNLLTLNEE